MEFCKLNQKRKNSIHTGEFYIIQKFLVALLGVLLLDCQERIAPESTRNYRQDMRNLVHSISSYAKQWRPNFIIIPQNGHELFTENGKANGQPVSSYFSTIDGVGREYLFYGFLGENIPTLASEQHQMLAFMNIALQFGKKVLVID